MDLNEIKQLAALMKEEGLTSLEYTSGAESIRMARGAAPGTAAAPAETADAAPADTAPAVPEADTDGTYTVTSPMVGVFYVSPSADKKPYVSLGDRVEAGDTLCIIEAMKMMNEITSEKSGTVVEICVGNKQIVEYGHPLFRLKLD